MDIKKIMDKFETEFLKNEDAILPGELFVEGDGNSVVGGKKLKNLSFKEVSMIKAPDFDKFSKRDQNIAMKIAEWWFDKFYATIKKPIIVPIEERKAAEALHLNSTKVTVKTGTKMPSKTEMKSVSSKAYKKDETIDDFYKDLKNSPAKAFNDIRKKK